MAQRGRSAKFGVSDFSRGLNTRFANTEIGDGQSPDLLNVRLDNKGEIRKRFGYEKVATSGIGSGTAAKDQFLYVKNDGTERHLVFSDTDIYERTSPSGTSWSSIKGSLTAATRYGFLEIDDLVYAGNGVESAWKYDGTTVTDVAAIPKGNILVYWQEKLWVAGDPSNPSQLYFSKTNAALGDVEDFTIPSGGGFLLLGKDDGQKITAVKTLGASLIVFKERSTYKVFFDETAGAYAQELLDPIYGCVGKDACVNVQNDIMFFTGEEVRRVGFDAQFFDQIRTNPISDEIGDQFDNLTDKTNTYLTFFDKKLYVAVSKNNSTVDTVYVLDTRYSGWMKWDSLNINSLLPDVLNNRLYFGAHNTDRVYLFNSSLNDDGAAISARWSTKRFDAESPELYKRFRWLFVVSRNSTGKLCYQVKVLDNRQVTISSVRCFNIDQNLTLQDWNLIDWNVVDYNVSDPTVEDPDLVYNRISLGGGEIPKGFSIQFIFTNDTVDEDLSLQQIVVEYSRKDNRHYPHTHTR